MSRMTWKYIRIPYKKSGEKNLEVLRTLPTPMYCHLKHLCGGDFCGFEEDLGFDKIKDNFQVSLRAGLKSNGSFCQTFFLNSNITSYFII